MGTGTGRLSCLISKAGREELDGSEAGDTAVFRGTCMLWYSDVDSQLVWSVVQVWSRGRGCVLYCTVLHWDWRGSERLQRDTDTILLTVTGHSDSAGA